MIKIRKKIKNEIRKKRNRIPNIDKESIKHEAIDICQSLYIELNKIPEVSFFITRKAIQIKLLIEKLV